LATDPKKKKDNDKDNDSKNGGNDDAGSGGSTGRDKSSYVRPTPTEDEITDGEIANLPANNQQKRLKVSFNL